MIRKCFSKIALLLICAATVAYGQSGNAPGRVSGKVTDDRGGIAANDVLTFVVTSGSGGYAYFTELPQGLSGYIYPDSNVNGVRDETSYFSGLTMVLTDSTGAITRATPARLLAWAKG